MATIQEAYRGAIERGEEWRLSHWTNGQYLKGVRGRAVVHASDGSVIVGFTPSTSEVISDDWERVPPTPRPTYLMLPCEKGKGTHWYDVDGMLYGDEGGKDTDYRQVAMPMTAEDMESISTVFTYAAIRPQESNLGERIRETLKLMKEAK